jgi:hypothetical protein
MENAVPGRRIMVVPVMEAGAAGSFALYLCRWWMTYPVPLDTLLHPGA